MPGRHSQICGQARHSTRYPMARSHGEAEDVGARRRAAMGELEKILAGHVVWRAALLQMARNQGVQDAHSRALVEIPRLYAMPGMRRRTPEARRPRVAAWFQARCGPRAAGHATLSREHRTLRRRDSARAAGTYGARSDA